jgi:hypothetical protein
MPIQLPKIDAQGPVGAPAAPRIEAKPLNTEGAMQMQQEALEGVGKEVIKYHDQAMQQEADNIATDADNKFQDWHKKELYGDPTNNKIGLLYQQGDPKALYNDFNKRAQEKLDSLSKAPEEQDWSGITQNVVNRRLNKRAEQLHDESLTAYGHQKYEYDKNLITANVDFAQKAMPLASANVDPDHPETFGPLMQKINDVKQPIIQHALQYGGAIKTEDGELILTPSVKAQISKAVSDGLYKTIDNLYNSDEGDGVSIKKADAIRQQFGDQMDPFHKDSLSDKAAKAATKQKSLELAGVIIAKGPNAPEVANAPLEVRQTALKYANEQSRDIEQLKQRKQNENYDRAAKAVDNVMRSGQPYAGVLMMRNDPTVKRVWDNLSAKQQQALEHSVEAPKTTSPAAQAKWLDVVTGKDPDTSLRGMSRTDLMTLTAGMKSTDAKAAVNVWTKMNSQTGPQVEQQYKAFGTEFEHQAVGAGLVHKAPNSNILTASDQPKYEQYKKELLDSIDHMGPMSPKERSDYVAKYVADKVAGRAFAPPTRATFNGTTKAPPPQGAANPAAPASPGTSPTPPLSGAAAYYGNLKESQKMEWIMKYRKQYGTIPKTDDLVKFIDKETNGK